MEISNNYAIQPQFKASFETVKIAQNCSRWSRIGKMFQNATKDIPNDKLILGYSKEDVRPFFFFTLNDIENHIDMIKVQNLGDWILSKSNKEISEKLVKLFKGMKLRHDSINEYRAAQLNTEYKDKEKSRAIKSIEKYYAGRMLAENKDDQEILNVFGASYIFDRLGIINALRELYVNCKNCW